MDKEPRGCLAFLFGFGPRVDRPQSPGNTRIDDPDAGEEGNYHSGPGGYEGMGYSGGYAADYFDHGHEGED
jgi:hypothetical protein